MPKSDRRSDDRTAPPLRVRAAAAPILHCVRCSTGSDHQCQGATELERAARQLA